MWLSLNLLTVGAYLRAALIASLAAALAFAGCNAGDSEDDVIENPPADSITISPVTASVVPGGSKTFKTASGNSNVSWTIVGKQSGDTSIDDNGKLHIAEDEPRETITVAATLESDQSKKCIAL
jgi:hypothetical protein